MKQKIQKSMMLILLVTLFPFYVIMTVILYNQNLGILEKEVQQEAVYLSSGVDVAGEEYLKKLEPMIKADEDTRLTFISQSGDVLYDSDSSKKLENHKSRAEVKQALAEGQGEDIRMSDTVGKELYYCAIRLDDGSVLRLARPMDSLIRTAWNILPVMLVLSVIGIALALFLANWQTKRLMEPVMHLDLEHPLDNVIYPEMVPLLEAIDRQNKEKEAVANMRKEFVAQPLAAAGALHQARYVHKLDDGRGLFIGLVHLRQLVQPLIRHSHHAHVGLDGAEGVVGALCPGVGDGVEQGAFANIW